MPHVLSKCEDPDVHNRVRKLRKQYHKELDDFDVTISILWASRKRDKDGELIDGPVLPLNGYETYAIIRRTTVKDRIHGVEDAVLTINRELWDRLSSEEQDALLDHELEHLELSRKPNNDVIYDDCDRPCLRIQLHDWQLGGFLAIARRHGQNALDVTNVMSVVTSETWQQLTLVWPDDAPSAPVKSLKVRSRKVAAKESADKTLGGK